MIATILSYILFGIFLILSGFHFYWLFGGKYGAKQAIPTKSIDAKPGRIPKYSTLIVAIGLMTIGLYYFGNTNNKIDVLESSKNVVLWIIPSVFVLRSIGEFKYVGFFKKIKNTEFATADTKLFSPLCLFIGIVGFVIQLL